MDFDEGKQLLMDSQSTEEEPKKNNGFIIDIEPIMFLYAFYISAHQLYVEQYIYMIISKEYNYTTPSENATVCTNDSLHSDLIMQQKVQSESSKVMLKITIAATLPAIISTLLLGPYCDQFGKKLPINITCFGAVFKCVTFAVVIATDASYWWFLFGCIVEGMTGFWFTFNMACYSYCGEVTSKENRTWKVTVVEVSNFVGIGLGQLLTGPIIHSIGYMYPFIILALLTGLASLYVILFLPDTIHNSDTLITKMKHILDKSYIETYAAIYLHNDSTNRRTKLILYLLMIVIVVPMVLARIDAQTYFLKGAPLCFTPNQVGYFTGGMTLFQGLSNLGLVFFCEKLIGDLWILVIGFTSGILYTVTFTFVDSFQMLMLSK